MQTFKAGLCYFALVFGAGFLLGSVRVPFLVPRLGVRVAELIEMPFMLVAIVLAARYVVSRFALEPSCRSRLPAGLLALTLLLVAELLLTLALQDQTLDRYIAGRDPVSGSVYLAMLVLFALMPLILVRFNAGRSRHRNHQASPQNE